MRTTQRAIITIEEDARTERPDNVLYAGRYEVEMPADYDPALVTGYDLLLDGAIRIVREVEE